MQLHKKCTLVREGCGYPRSRASVGISISVLAHLVMKRTIKFITRLNFILKASYNAMAAVAVNGLSTSSPDVMLLTIALKTGKSTGQWQYQWSKWKICWPHIVASEGIVCVMWSHMISPYRPNDSRGNSTSSSHKLSCTLILWPGN